MQFGGDNKGVDCRYVGNRGTESRDVDNRQTDNRGVDGRDSDSRHVHDGHGKTGPLTSLGPKPFHL